MAVWAQMNKHLKKTTEVKRAAVCSWKVRASRFISSSCWYLVSVDDAGSKDAVCDVSDVKTINKKAFPLYTPTVSAAKT